jgi:hypothetical protein
METTGTVASTATVVKAKSPDSARLPAASFEHARTW